MDFDTGITIVLILLVVTVVAVVTLMTITFNWARRKVKGTNNIDKKQALRFAFNRNIFTNYSEGERAQGFIYYYIGCAILLVVMIAIIVGFVLMN